MLLFLTLVLAIGAVGGIWPAIASAVAASLLLNWYFTPPIHTWTIAEPENLLALLVFVAVAIAVSVLVDRAERSRAEAARGRGEAEALARLAGSLAAEEDPLPTLVRQVTATFGLEGAAVLTPTADRGWRVEAASGAAIVAAGGDESIDLEDDGVLVLRGRHLPADQRRVLAAFAAQLTAAVRTRALERDVAEAERVSEVSDLRAAILSAVSHDLRTPLASIKAAASSLRQRDVSWSEDERDDFLATIEEETDRLTDLVGNLLDMSRIQSGMLRLTPSRVGLDEVVLRASPASRVEDTTSRSTSPRTCRGSTSTLPCSSRRRTWSRTPGRSARGLLGRCLRIGGRRSGRTAGGRPGSRHPGRGSPAGLRERSSGSATARASTASVSVSRWRVGSSRRWGAPSRPTTPREAA